MNTMNSIPRFIKRPRLAHRDTTGKPFLNTPEERGHGRATAAARAEREAAALARQRARLDARLPAANDNADPRWRGNLPVLHSIARQDPEAAYAVSAWGRASSSACVFGAEDASDIDSDGNPVEMHGERVHDLRPSLHCMLTDVLRVRIVTECRGDGGFEPGRDRNIDSRHEGPDARPQRIGGDVYRLAGMRFNFNAKARRPAGGLLTSYTDANGTVREPFFDTSKARGTTRDASGRKPGVKRPPILTDYVDRPEVSPETASILEMILSGMHLYQIGEALGYSQGYADRGAKRHIAAAVADVKGAYPLTYCER